MAGVLNDWGCDTCGKVRRNMVFPSGESPECCGRSMVCRWDHGQAPSTDMHEPEFNHATGQWHRSSREVEMTLAKQAQEWSARTGMKLERPIAAGDKVHGAREETRARQSAFGYAGQGRRRSTAERGPAPRGTYTRDTGTAPDTAKYAVNGIAPRRLSREEARRERGLAP